METLLKDIRYGLRMLLRSPGFTVVALLPVAKVEPLLKEANELVAIMAASRISAARGKQSAIATRKSEI